MTSQNELQTPSINTAILGKRMLLGTGIGLILILFFVLGVGEPNPAWGKLWMVRPLIITPLAGATCGACYYFINYRYQHGWQKVIAVILGVIVYIIGLWMGTVLGLAGTMWN